MGYDLRGYLVYRRTISRPGYQLLNPSQRYVDPYLFETGNPALRPQFTQNYEANISVDERPIFAIGVNDTKDIFTNVVYQSDTSSRVAYRTYDNLGSNKAIPLLSGLIAPERHGTARNLCAGNIGRSSSKVERSGMANSRSGGQSR